MFKRLPVIPLLPGNLPFGPSGSFKVALSSMGIAQCLEVCLLELPLGNRAGSIL